MGDNSFLIVLEDNSLGDMISNTSFFKDFSNQYPNKKIYVINSLCNILPYYQRFIDVYKNNIFVKIWNNEQVDKVIKFKNFEYLQQSKYNNDIDITEGIYDYFYKQTGIKVEKNTYNTVLSLSDSEKSDLILKKFNILTNKPIGIINFGVHPIYNTCKLQNNIKLQNIVNSTQNNIYWIQVGKNFSYQNFALQNVLNLIDKTTTRELFSLIYHSNYVICPTTSLIHISAMDDIQNNIHKQIFIFFGNRENINWYKSYYKNINTSSFYFLNYNPTKYTQCINNNEKCCLCDIMFLNDQNKKLNLKLCKNIKYFNNIPIAQCLMDINETYVINKINKGIN